MSTWRNLSTSLRRVWKLWYVLSVLLIDFVFLSLKIAVYKGFYLIKTFMYRFLDFQLLPLNVIAMDTIRIIKFSFITKMDININFQLI
jgi:hypothetical protein